jgi:DNA-directed RNA polymerase subunit RPC12/RpoP
MVKCPKCKSEVNKPRKQWTYGYFDVMSYNCQGCGTKFREYTSRGKLRSVLMFKDGRYRKP